MRFFRSNFSVDVELEVYLAVMVHRTGPQPYTQTKGFNTSLSDSVSGSVAQWVSGSVDQWMGRFVRASSENVLAHSIENSGVPGFLSAGRIAELG